MAGRPSKPTQLLKIEGKSHRTKKEIEDRELYEEELKTNLQFSESESVKKDKTAHAEFKRLQKLYSGINFVDGLDEQIINRYCLEISNQSTLQYLLELMQSKLEEIESAADVSIKDLTKLYKSINDALGKIYKSKELLLKYEDRLFLNPAARIKSVPKKETPKPKSELELKGFGDV